VGFEITPIEGLKKVFPHYYDVKNQEKVARLTLSSMVEKENIPTD